MLVCLADDVGRTLSALVVSSVVAATGMRAVDVASVVNAVVAGWDVTFTVVLGCEVH